MRIALSVAVLVGGCDLVYSLDRPSTTGFSELAVGNTHSCARTLDRALYCWGSNAAGEVGTGDELEIIDTPQRVAGEWIELEASYASTCGIKADATLWCWGANNAGQLGTGSTKNGRIPKQLAGAWKHVATGFYNNCAIDADDHLWCWGTGAYGVVGDGSTTTRFEPVQVGGATWRSVALAGASGCGIQTDDTLWCWGDSAQVPLGDPGLTGIINAPARIGSDHWRVLGGVFDGMCGITTGGQLRCWGRNTQQDLGIDTTEMIFEPTPVTIDGVDADDWTAVEGGTLTACGLRDGEAWCWGANERGQFAHSEAVLPRPVRVDHPSGDAWTQVSLGTNNGCFVDAHARAWCAGNNGSSQLGAGGASPRAPMLVDGTQTMLDAGDGLTCALRGDQLVCSGANSSGQLGVGDQHARRGFDVAVEGTWTAISGGLEHQCALDGAGMPWCWGLSLGVPHGFADVPDTRPVSAGSQVFRQIDSGANHVCAIAPNAIAWCWGSNGSGELGDSTAMAQTTPQAVRIVPAYLAISAGDRFTCGVDTQSDVRCWGSNREGQLGDGTNDDRSLPTLVKGFFVPPSFRAVSAGGDHACALTDDNQLFCWGGNDRGQLGYDAFPFATNVARPVLGTWLSVSAGRHFTCALRDDTTAWCWGANSRGQIGDGTLLDRPIPTQIAGAGWTAITAGTDHACGLREGMTYCWGNNDDGATATDDAWTTELQEIVEPPR